MSPIQDYQLDYRVYSNSCGLLEVCILGSEGKLQRQGGGRDAK